MPKQSNLHRPTWQADTDVKTCTLCITVFTITTRRHHCRSCGFIVCGNCSPHRLALPTFGYVFPMRVCTSCETPETRKCYGDSINSVTDNEEDDLEFSQQQQPVKEDDDKPACIHPHSTLSSFGKTVLNVLQEYAQDDWRFMQNEAVKVLQSLQVITTTWQAQVRLLDLVQSGFLRRMGSTKWYVLCPCRRVRLLKSISLNVPRRRDAAMQACTNCTRSFHKSASSLPFFCSLDCQTTMVFRQNDQRRASQYVKT